MMTIRNACAHALALLVAMTPTSTAWADPCGMVPPIWLGDGPPIERIGLQRTYVFYKDGVESIVLRPGFAGRVDEFGMLIPFPSPPAIRKVADDVFAHVASAIDPPEVVVDLRLRMCYDEEVSNELMSLGYAAGRKEKNASVVVLRREAVGMYEVAVLEAGSADALQGWMEEHGFRYPDGMNETCEEYIQEGWCFVAIKARVGKQSGSQARPGMRTVDTELPAGASFDGHVQAMGFRFSTDKMVVPMRLSAFNPGELRNVVYILSEGPERIANLPESFVVRQVPGWQIYRNLTNPLPVRVLGGGLEDIPDWRRQGLDHERDPLPHNGIARELFASDLLAARNGQLAHEHEQREKELLEIGERLGLRGPEIDALHAEALRAEREAMIASALADLEGMTLSVVDADFPRHILAAENLTFVDYDMSSGRNHPELYDARHEGPAPVLGGTLANDTLNAVRRPARVFVLSALALAAYFALRATRGRSRTRRAGLSAAALASLYLLVGVAGAAPQSALVRGCGVERLDAQAVHELSEQRDESIRRLMSEARAAESVASRGWAIVALSQLDARQGLGQIASTSESTLVRTWATAALAMRSDSPRELVALSQLTGELPATVRPLKLRWHELLSDTERPVPLAFALEAIAGSGILQQELLPVLLERPTEDFVQVMLTSHDDNLRNLTAGSLATLASQGRAQVSKTIISALTFSAGNANVPWSGGALFLPGLQWTADSARKLMRELIAWHLWCDTRELEAEQRQIDRNLNSWNLANVLDFPMPGGDVTSDRWLGIWRKIAGRRAVRALVEQVEGD